MPIRRHENIWTLVRPTTVFDVVTGEMITPAALQQRKKSRGEDKVLDPVTGEMITPNALRKRKIVMTGDPTRLRGHWSTNAPVIGIADHRNGFRLDTDDYDRRVLERSVARQQGGAAIAVCRRSQSRDLKRLQEVAKTKRKPR